MRYTLLLSPARCAMLCEIREAQAPLQLTAIQFAPGTWVLAFHCAVSSGGPEEEESRALTRNQRRKRALRNARSELDRERERERGERETETEREYPPLPHSPHRHPPPHHPQFILIIITYSSRRQGTRA
eukprot:2694670-Rhodomonas_salina.1